MPCTAEMDCEQQSADNLPFDLNMALERLGGDQVLMREITEIFLRECPGHVKAIRDAVERRDPLRLYREAHMLKGSVSNFFAPAATEAALRLELMGRQHSLDGAEKAFSMLQESMAVLCRGLERLESRLSREQ